MRKIKQITEIFRIESGEIQFTCIRCCKKMIAKPMLAGSLSRCPLCQKLIKIPKIPEILHFKKPPVSKHLVQNQSAPTDPLLDPQEITPLTHSDKGEYIETENLLDALMHISMYSPIALMKSTITKQPKSSSKSFLDFEIIEKLGDGGMGSVFRVRKKGAEYALKLLDPSLVKDNRYLIRFEQEAQILSKINHPNIVRVFEFGVHKNRPYILMEFCNGPSLRELVYRRGPMPLPLATIVVRDIAKGLLKASGLGLVHRDVKPDNILFQFEQGKCVVKLVDFGLVKQIGKMKIPKKALHLTEKDLAEISEEFSKQIRRIYKGRDSGLSWQEKISKILENIRSDFRKQKKLHVETRILKEFEYLNKSSDDSYSLDITKTGECFGTPKYMAPEMWLDVPSDFRADIFALGVTWFWLISGNYPYGGKNANETMKLVLNEEPTPIEFFNSVVPKAVKSMLETMTSKLPDLRYQSYELLIDDLNRLLDGDEPVIDAFGEVLQIDRVVEFDSLEQEADFLFNTYKAFIRKVLIEPSTEDSADLPEK